MSITRQALPPFLRTRGPLVALAISTGAVFAVGFAPLFDGPGYEIALAAGLIVPSFAAIATALEGSATIAAWRAGAAARKKHNSVASATESEIGAGSKDGSHLLGAQEPSAQPEAGSGGIGPVPRRVGALDLLFRGIANGAAFALAAYLTTLIHGARTGFCDAWTGSKTFALGPFCGAILGGAWGAVAAEIAGRRALRSSPAPDATPPSRAHRVRRALTGRSAVATLLAFAGPLAAAAVSFGRFLTSPMVFAYDPFAGYFSGTLYDTIIDTSGLLSYRAGSLATLLAALVLAWHLRPDEQGRLRFRWRGRMGVALAGALCALASATHIAYGPELGHYQTAATIASALGARAEGARCTVLHNRGVPSDEVERFVADCDAHVAQVEAWFEAKGPDRITVYLFGNTGQKAYLMGAADTQIAKPWRHEVYVQQMSYPHPVIGHELAHVIAGSFAGGPFAVGADLGGLLPNPGLIEGVAVAASPKEGDLTAAEWAKAMKDLNLLPKLGNLFALSFLGQSSGVAYTVSGAFVGFVKDTYGAAAVRDWYGGRKLPDVTGASWSELEAKFHATLDALPLTDAARAQAKARFDRPGIFGRRCPHVVDACNRRAGDLRGGGDEDGALEQYAIVRQLDPNDAMVRVHIARAKIQKGDAETGRAELAALAAEEKVPRHVRDRALEDLADAALAPGGDGAMAAATYRELMTRTVDEDTLRTLEVKALAAESPRSYVREAIHQYLIGDVGRGSDRVRAAELFGVWSREAPDEGLPPYLMARYFHGAGLYSEAAERLDAAMARRLPTTRVEVEALRLRLVGACAVRDPIAVRKAYDAYRARPEVPRARRDAMASLVARCTGDPAPIPAR